ncbi:MAG: ABC transporter substrate-binding protein [Phycisphaerales bacterium]|jgi:ABC-type hemin transport system substrate-binding protein|nr:ABC transporter substrate-binding protein [Phycisphaerales bacterium]
MKRAMILFLAMLTFFGCDRELPRPEAPAPRTVSFSPALTELMFEMEFGNHIVGVTTYCQPPEGVDIPIVGNDLNITVEPILAVEPDILLTQSSVGRFDTLASLRPDIRIELIKIETLSQIADAMVKLADLMGQPTKGQLARIKFLAELKNVRIRVAGRARPKVIFLMGHHDPSTAGRGTFIDELIETAGGVNVAADGRQGWPKIGIEAILKLKPDVIICESDQSTADEARQYWSELTKASPQKVRVHIVTDKRLTIPTGRTAGVFAPMLADFLHPETRRGSGK